MAGETGTEDRALKLAGARRMLALGIAISIGFVMVELVVGLMTGSLSLVSDAAHNAADTFAMALALFAVFMMSREPTERMTYGYGRVGILTALANALVLIAVAGVLIYEAIHRIVNIEEVSGTTITVVAGVALVVNAIVALLLFRYRRDLSVRSAFLHMVTDAGVSLGVLFAGIVIAFTRWYYADPVAALIVSLFILYAAWDIIMEATDVLLESVPRHIDMNSVRGAMESVDGVETVHHLHVWELGSGVYALSGHVEVEDRSLSECSGITKDINEVLLDKFNIVHPTIQLECPRACRDEDDRSRI